MKLSLTGVVKLPETPEEAEVLATPRAAPTKLSAPTRDLTVAGKVTTMSPVPGVGSSR